MAALIYSKLPQCGTLVFEVRSLARLSTATRQHGQQRQGADVGDLVRRVHGTRCIRPTSEAMSTFTMSASRVVADDEGRGVEGPLWVRSSYIDCRGDPTGYLGLNQSGGLSARLGSAGKASTEVAAQTVLTLAVDGRHGRLRRRQAGDHVHDDRRAALPRQSGRRRHPRGPLEVGRRPGRSDRLHRPPVKAVAPSWIDFRDGQNRFELSLQCATAALSGAEVTGRQGMHTNTSP